MATRPANASDIKYSVIGYVPFSLVIASALTRSGVLKRAADRAGGGDHLGREPYPEFGAACDLPPDGRPRAGTFARAG